MKTLILLIALLMSAPIFAQSGSSDILYLLRGSDFEEAGGNLYTSLNAGLYESGGMALKISPPAPFTLTQTGAETQVILDYVETEIAVKKYVALLTQTGTNAPVATVLENTLGGVPTWARSFSGIYTLTLIGSFPSADKVFMEISNQATNALVGTFTSAGVLIFNNFSDHNAVSLGDEVKAYIEIRVYP